MAGLAAALAVQVATIDSDDDDRVGRRRVCRRRGRRHPIAGGVADAAAPGASRCRGASRCGGASRYRGWGLGACSGREPAPASPEPQPLLAAGTAYVAGVAAWFIPLVVISGGPAAYWRALTNQGAEDFGNIVMLWTKRDRRGRCVDTLYFALVAPWATWTVAIVVLAFAVARRRLAVACGSHCAGDPCGRVRSVLRIRLLFQETFTTRYALPLVVPMAYLAMAGTRWLPGNAGIVVAVLVAGFDAHVGGTSIAAFARQKTPAFRLLDDMAAAAKSAPAAPVLAMDRRNAFDFRRPIVWAGGAMPRFARTLPAPPQHEWLEPMRTGTAAAARRSGSSSIRSARASIWCSTASRHDTDGRFPIRFSSAASRPERDGLVPRRAARVVRRRGVGADAGNRGRRRRRSSRSRATGRLMHGSPPRRPAATLMIGGRDLR